MFAEIYARYGYELGERWLSTQITGTYRAIKEPSITSPVIDERDEPPFEYSREHVEAEILGTLREPEAVVSVAKPTLVAAKDLRAGDEIYDSQLREFVVVKGVNADAKRAATHTEVHYYAANAHPISRNRSLTTFHNRKFETRKAA